MPNPQVVVDFVANTAKLQSASGELGGRGAKAGQAFSNAMLPAVATLGLIAAGSMKAMDAASSLNEQMSASTQVFGNHAKGVQRWSQTGAKAFGLSATESLKAANAYGNMFNAVGLGAGETAKMSTSMVQLAGDMASFHDQDPTEMLQKLQAGLAGEAEPLRKFGVLMSDAAVKTFAYQNGIAKSGSELTEAQKVQARYGLIMQSTTKAQGDFARTSESVANQQRTLAAETENTSAAFGTALLPVAQSVLKIFQAIIGVFRGNTTAMTAFIAVIAALAAAIIGVNIAMSVYAVTSKILTASIAGQTVAQWLLNAATAAFPVLLIVAGLAAMVAGLILAYKHSETFRAIVDGAFDAVLSVAKTLFNWLRSNWPLLLAIIGGPVVAAALLVARNWETIRSVTTGAWEAVKSAVTGAVEGIKHGLSAFGTWVSGFASGVLSLAVGRVTDQLDKIGDAGHAAYSAVKEAVGKIAGAISAVVGAVGKAAGDVAGAIKGPINAVVHGWNSLAFPRVSINIPKFKIGKKSFGGGSFGFGPYAFPDMPSLAKGGVVSDPTLALVGDVPGGGREIVAPEALLREIVAGAGGPSVRVFIGDTELRGIIRTEVVDATTGIARTLIAKGA